MTAVRKSLHVQKTEETMGIKFLKKSKPESERVEMMQKYAQRLKISCKKLNAMATLL
jgi:hypothetical protein